MFNNLDNFLFPKYKQRRSTLITVEIITILNPHIYNIDQ
ncbi:hypothetical protein DCCM_2886 [Desulfocucumis palustris]|uniref:Uncharacterized protein n=1 Tax=Desulfocucumis palustris TaxID=1898651 RepID=A0A2L2XC25_9FIRM|nr:hypothetical protein DCCM_2886 [Desulfocucumis palustris]